MADKIKENISDKLALISVENRESSWQYGRNGNSEWDSFRAPTGHV